MIIRIAIVLALCLVAAIAPWTPFARETEERTIDLRFRLRGPLPEKGRVVIVAIDDETEKAWRDIPKAMWSGELAKIVRALHAGGAKRIALDFVISGNPDAYLSSKGIDEAPNSELAQAIEETDGRALLGTAQPGDLGPPLDAIEAWASVNRMPEEVGVVRRAPRIDESFSPPLIGMAAALAGDGSRRVDPIQINYSGRPLVVISARDLIEGRAQSEVFRGALVIVGETYSSSADLHETPYGTTIPGVLIHAEAALTLVDAVELKVLPLWATSIVAMLATLAGSLLALRFFVGSYFAVMGVASTFWTLTCYGLFVRMDSVWPWTVPITMTMVLVPGTIYGLRAVEERSERLWARSIWGQMVGESTLNRLEANRKGELGAWDEFEGGILFLDIAGFSEFTKRCAGRPEAVVEALNTRFGPIVELIEREGGEVLNFMGDGLAAKWETPGGESPDLTRTRVLQAALDLLALVDSLNVRREGGVSLDVRIGLSWGSANLALVGSAKRKQMTLYGEAVNLAARLEAAGKEISIRSRLVMSDEYEANVRATGQQFEQIAFLPKGWDLPLQVWRLAEKATNLPQ